MFVIVIYFGEFINQLMFVNSKQYNFLYVLNDTQMCCPLFSTVYLSLSGQLFSIVFTCKTKNEQYSSIWFQHFV